MSIGDVDKPAKKRHGNTEALRKAKGPTLMIAGLLLFLLFLWAIYDLPKRQANEVATPRTEKYFQIENQARGTLLQVLGNAGIFLFVTTFIAWRKLLLDEETQKIADKNREIADKNREIADKNREIAEKNRQIAEDKQIADRFVKACEMLANNKQMAVRLGGVYTLERIAKDSKQDRTTVLEVLISYIREASPVNNPLPARSKMPEDVQAALMVLGKEELFGDKEKDLSNIDLRYANLRETQLNNVKLTNSELSNADFSGAFMNGVNFSGTHQKVNFKKAQLTEAKFNESIFHGSDFSEAILINAEFLQCDLSKAQFPKADLTGATLKGAKFSGALFFETILKNTDLDRADLSEICCLSPDSFVYQIKNARNGRNAHYSAYIAAALGLSEAEQTKTLEDIYELWRVYREWKNLGPLIP